MSPFISKDFKSELTFGKISAKVLVTVAVAVGWFLIQNLSEYLPKIYKNISQTLYDRMIETVAHGPKDYDAMLVLTFIYFMSLFLCFSSYLMLKVLSRRLKSLDGKEVIKTYSRESLIKRFRILKTTGKVLFVITWLIFIGSFFSIGKVEAEIEITRDFNRKINIVTPYIEIKQKEKIISDFALMKNEVNYLKIKATLDSIFLANKLNP